MRVVLIPFHTTPSNIQLDVAKRDEIDQQLKDAMSKASCAAAHLIQLGNEVIAQQNGEQQVIIQKVRDLAPGVTARVHRSYSWLLTATMKVCCPYYMSSNFSLFLLPTCTLKILEKAALRTQLADCVWAHFQEEIVPEIRAYQTAKDSEQTMSHQVIHNLI